MPLTQVKCISRHRLLGNSVYTLYGVQSGNCVLQLGVSRDPIEDRLNTHHLLDTPLWRLLGQICR